MMDIGIYILKRGNVWQRGTQFADTHHSLQLLIPDPCCGVNNEFRSSYWIILRNVFRWFVLC